MFIVILNSFLFVCFCVSEQSRQNHALICWWPTRDDWNLYILINKRKATLFFYICKYCKVVKLLKNKYIYYLNWIMPDLVVSDLNLSINIMRFFFNCRTIYWLLLGKKIFYRSNLLSKIKRIDKLFFVEKNNLQYMVANVPVRHSKVTYKNS